MSALQQRPYTTIGVPHPDDGPMALCIMGIGYFGSLSNRNQANEIFSSGDRLLH